jgi:hypothetical protein
MFYLFYAWLNELIVDKHMWVGKNKEHKMRCYSCNRAWETDVFLGFEVQQRLHRWEGWESWTLTLTCLDIPSEKRSVNRITKLE